VEAAIQAITGVIAVKVIFSKQACKYMSNK
jgi:hypothetical protein